MHVSRKPHIGTSTFGKFRVLVQTMVDGEQDGTFSVNDLQPMAGLPELESILNDLVAEGSIARIGQSSYKRLPVGTRYVAAAIPFYRAIAQRIRRGRLQHSAEQAGRLDPSELWRLLSKPVAGRQLLNVNELTGAEMVVLAELAMGSDIGDKWKSPPLLHAQTRQSLTVVTDLLDGLMLCGWVEKQSPTSKRLPKQWAVTPEGRQRAAYLFAEVEDIIDNATYRMPAISRPSGSTRLSEISHLELTSLRLIAELVVAGSQGRGVTVGQLAKKAGIKESGVASNLVDSLFNSRRLRRLDQAEWQGSNRRERPVMITDEGIAYAASVFDAFDQVVQLARRDSSFGALIDGAREEITSAGENERRGTRQWLLSEPLENANKTARLTGAAAASIAAMSAIRVADSTVKADAENLGKLSGRDSTSTRKTLGQLQEAGWANAGTHLDLHALTREADDRLLALADLLEQTTYTAEQELDGLML